MKALPTASRDDFEEGGRSLAEKSIPDRFALVVSRHQERLAVSSNEHEWTYGELDSRATALAAWIRGLDVPASNPVALLMEHDAPLIAAILTVLKAGRMYLALDPAHPPGALAAILEDSKAELLWTDPTHLKLAKSLAGDSPRVVTTPDLPLAEPAPLEPPSASPTTGAWLMYTSGSTGARKGVWQNHEGVVRMADAYAELIKAEPGDRFSLLASCSLSASTSPIFAALLNGAALCLFDLRRHGAERLADWLRDRKITIFHSVPAVFRQLARLAPEKLANGNLRVVRLGGEPVLRSDVELYRRHCSPRCRLMQSYGATETGLITAMIMDQSAAPDTHRISAGQPAPGVEVFLVDDLNRPLPPGGEGRIAIRSAYLPLGYWRRPDLTAERYLADGDEACRRVFLSNDLGRILPDGSLEHLGRADQVVKIRGQRVDVSELEAALLATGLCHEAVVTAPEDGAGDRRLIAYFVPCAGADTSPSNLRKELRARAPEHMIPAEFIALKELPRLAAGKIDRRTLPAPPEREVGSDLPRGRQPRDVFETKVARVWRSVLGISSVGRYDDFFDVGGTSLQAIDVLARLEDVFGVSLSPSALAQYSTVEKLAGLLAKNLAAPAGGPLVVLREGGQGSPLFLIHSGQGDVASYGLLARRLHGRPIYGFQSVGLHGESWPLMSVQAMARRYMGEMITRQPSGPYLLAGTCMGGMVALELGRMLAASGRKVGLLALLDSNYPQPTSRHHRRAERLYGPFRNSVRDAGRILRWAIIRAAGLGRRPRLLPAYRRFVAHMNSRANRAYRPAFYPGEMLLFITTAAKTDPLDDRRLWLARQAQTPRIIRVEGDRIALFAKPMVDELARELQSAIDRAEK